MLFLDGHIIGLTILFINDHAYQTSSKLVKNLEEKIHI